MFDPYEPIAMNPQDQFNPYPGQYPGGGIDMDGGGGEYVPAPSYFEAPFQQGVSYVPLTEQGQSPTPQIFPVEDPNQMQGYEAVQTESSASQEYGGLVQGEAAVGACGCKNGGCKNKAIAGAQTSGCGCKGGCKNNNVPLQGQVQGQEQSASYNEMKHARTSPVACASCKVDAGAAAQVAAMSTFAMSPSVTPMQRQVMSPQVTDGNQVDIVAIGASDDSEGSHKPRLGGHKPTLGGHKPTLGGESEDASVQRFYQYGYTEGVANRAEGRSYGSRPGFMEKLGFTGPFYADKETPLRRRQYEAVLQGLRDAWFAGAV